MRRVGIANAGDRFHGMGVVQHRQIRSRLPSVCNPDRRDVRDRIAYLFAIRATLRSLFRDLDVENEWLREPHSSLRGKSPLALLSNGSAEDLLIVKEYVDTTAGR